MVHFEGTVPRGTANGCDAKAMWEGTRCHTWRPGENTQIPGDPHGGSLWICDAAMGMALASTIAPDKSFETIELKISISFTGVGGTLAS